MMFQPSKAENRCQKMLISQVFDGHFHVAIEAVKRVLANFFNALIHLVKVFNSNSHNQISSLFSF